MTQIRTNLEPPVLRCTRGVAFPAGEFGATMRVKEQRESHSAGTSPKVRALATLCVAAALVGCGSYAAGARDLVQDKSMVAVSVGAVGHYGSGIGVPNYSINGLPVGLSYGWGGGGAGWCCVLLPRHVNKPFMVTVKWETYRSNVSEERHHEATVPVNFAVQPGQGGSGLFLHFFPGHRVEAWYAGPTPPSSKYPGPPFPHAPAPRYAPLPEEAPSPAQ